MVVKKKKKHWKIFTTKEKCERCNTSGTSIVVFMHKPPEKLCKNCFEKAKNSGENLLDIIPST